MTVIQAYLDAPQFRSQGHGQLAVKFLPHLCFSQEGLPGRLSSAAESLAKPLVVQIDLLDFYQSECHKRKRQ